MLVFCWSRTHKAFQGRAPVEAALAVRAELSPTLISIARGPITRRGPGVSVSTEQRFNLLGWNGDSGPTLSCGTGECADPAELLSRPHRRRLLGSPHPRTRSP